jgi:hypothetical protein
VFVLEEIWRVGGIDAVPEAEFTGPFFVTAFGPNGEATVLDQTQARVSMFHGGNGAFIRAFGREGQGPGDLHAPAAMAWDNRARLWIANSFNGRYTVFDTTGELIKIVSRPMHSTNLRVFPLVVTRSGTIMDHSPAGLRVRVLVMDTLGAVQDSLVFVRSHSARLPVGFVMPGSELSRSLTAVAGLQARSYWAYSRDAQSIWLARSDSLSLFQVSLSGDTIRRVRTTHRRAEFTPAQRDAIRRANRLLGEDGDFSPILVQRLHVLEDGRVLVQLGNDWSTPGREFELFDSTGTWLGSVMAPFAVHHRSELASRGDTLLVSAVGQLDVPLLIKAVLKPAGEDEMRPLSMFERNWSSVAKRPAPFYRSDARLSTGEGNRNVENSDVHYRHPGATVLLL